MCCCMRHSVRHFRRIALSLSFFFFFFFKPLLQEYDKCYNLVRECAPHARIAYDCTSIESFRESFSTSSFSHSPYLGTLLTLVICRSGHITNVATPHDAAQTDIENKVEGL